MFNLAMALRAKSWWGEIKLDRNGKPLAAPLSGMVVSLGAALAYGDARAAHEREEIFNSKEN